MVKVGEPMTVEKTRITMIDALRGFALVGIVVLHQIEHFNFFADSIHSPSWLIEIDKLVTDLLYFLFAGKAFALFSVLFGFSFFLQYQSRIAKKEKYAGRFFWRMFLLLLFGLFHTIFYGGDILFLYALLSFPLFILRNSKDKVILITAIILLSSPFGLYELATSLINIELPDLSLDYPPSMDDERGGSSFLALAIVNFKYGLWEHVAWGWGNGRIFAIPGLFLFGLWLARKNILLSLTTRQNLIILGVTLLIYLPIHITSANLDYWQVSNQLRDSVWRLLKSYGNFCVMLVFLSLFLAIWKTQIGRQKLMFLAPFGRIGLTNYILSSIIGTILYHGWGFSLYLYCGATLTVIIAIVTLVFQFKLSSWILQHYAQGPLEMLWRKLTWFNFSRRLST